MNNEPTPMLRDVLIGMGAVSLALMSLVSDEQKRDEDFFQQVYYAALAANDILELIRMLQEYRDRDHQPWEQTFDYSAEKKKDPSGEEKETDLDDLPTPQSAEPVIPKYIDDDEDYDEEYARNHGEDDYDEDEQGWGLGMGM